MKKISSYIPAKSYSIINQWLEKYNCEVTVSHPRKSKLGDYRSPHKNNKHLISVNNDLNKYAFLITLTHEIAHMIIWEKYENNFKSTLSHAINDVAMVVYYVFIGLFIANFAIEILVGPE